VITVFAHADGFGGLAPLGPVALVALLYARRAATLRASGRPVPHHRIAAFASGLAIVALASASPLGHVAEELLAAHVVEHVLLADIGPLLLVVGVTGPVLAPALRHPVFSRLRPLGHPVVALALWAANLAAWHLPALHEAAVRSVAVHALQHALLLGLGGALWMPLFGPLPRPAWFGTVARGGYVLLIGASGAVLANLLLWIRADLYGVYSAGRAAWGITAADDQGVAGGIMLFAGSVVTLGLVAWLVLQAIHDAEERQGLLDLATSRRVPLTEDRAARAVAAGRAGELRRRLVDQRPD